MQHSTNIELMINKVFIWCINPFFIFDEQLHIIKGRLYFFKR
jgi:hypothetical protein